MEVLCSEITIQGKRFNGVNDVKIVRSIYELSAVATIKVPVTAVLKQKGAAPAKIETAKAIKRGDRVVVKLGYNGALRTEFCGYVKNINLATPIEIECEDEFYKCRQRSVKLSGTTSLADLLRLCELDAQHVETLNLRNFAITDQPTPSVASVLAKLQTDYGLTLFFDLDGKFCAARPERLVGEKVKYELRRNVISDDDLTYHRSDDVKIEIKAVCIKRDGTKIEATKGAKDGASKTLYFYDVQDVNELATLADIELRRNSYDGYDGSIETFLMPFAAPCMVADLTDPIYSDRDGSYFIEAVTTTFGMSGARRTVTLGTKI